MKKNNFIKVGGAGVVIAALCCFTPILVVLLGAVGLSALTGYLDIVLLPALIIFFAILAYGLMKKSSGAEGDCCDSDNPNTENK